MKRIVLLLSGLLFTQSIATGKRVELDIKTCTEFVSGAKTFREQAYWTYCFAKLASSEQFKNPEEAYIRGQQVDVLSQDLRSMQAAIIGYRNFKLTVWDEEPPMLKQVNFTGLEENFLKDILDTLSRLKTDYQAGAIGSWPRSVKEFRLLYAAEQYADILKKCRLFLKDKSLLPYQVFAVLDRFNNIASSTVFPVERDFAWYSLKTNALFTNLELLKQMMNKSGNTGESFEQSFSLCFVAIKEAHTLLYSSSCKDGSKKYGGAKATYRLANLFLKSALNRLNTIEKDVQAGSAQVVFGRLKTVLEKLIKEMANGSLADNKLLLQVNKKRDSAKKILNNLLGSIAYNSFVKLRDTLEQKNNLSREELLKFVAKLHQAEKYFLLPTLIFPLPSKIWRWDETDSVYKKLQQVRLEIDQLVYKRFVAQEKLLPLPSGDWHSNSFGQTLEWVDKIFGELELATVTPDTAVKAYFAKLWICDFHDWICQTYLISEEHTLASDHQWLFLSSAEEKYKKVLERLNTIINICPSNSSDFCEVIIKRAPQELKWMKDKFNILGDCIYFMPLEDYLDDLIDTLELLSKNKDYIDRKDLLEVLESGEEFQKELQLNPT